MVIVVDISGSMSGTKMTKAKKSAKADPRLCPKFIRKETYNLS